MKNFKDTFLVTGSAGFIGQSVSYKLLQKGYKVIGIDNFDNYYSLKLKKFRIKSLLGNKNFYFLEGDIRNNLFMKTVISKYLPDVIFNLAAKAGVRYSIKNPKPYVDTNIYGVINILNLMKDFGIKKIVLASTSSVYSGNLNKISYSENFPVNTPISPYAGTKRSMEILSYTYHFLNNLDISIVRYFTVYGPFGRPDMSIYRFIENMLCKKDIKIYGDGKQKRDFTYISDIVDGTIKAMKLVGGYEIFNLGCGGKYPISIQKIINIISKILKITPTIKYLPSIKADMQSTWANIKKSNKILNWKSKIKIKEGLEKTINWHLNQFNMKNKF
jgi:UDP-glucuronate 4-epimerase